MLKSIEEGEGHIDFNDGDSATFTLNDRDVFYLPIEQCQWKRTTEHDNIVFQLKFCEVCWCGVDPATGYLCARCNSTAICKGCVRANDDLPGSIFLPVELGSLI